MYRTIVVPLDGSVFAEHAVPLAISLGKQTGATVRLLRVVPPLADYLFLPPNLNDPLDAELRTLHRKEAQAYLEYVVGRIKDAGPVVCDVMEEEDGVAESICADVVRSKADLIILSSHGRGALARFWLGSIADKLVRTAPVPVLLSRPKEGLPAADIEHPMALKHCLLALDGKADAEKVIDPALALGNLAGVEYTLVKVVRPLFPRPFSHNSSDADPTAMPKGLKERDAANWRRAEEYLRKVADRLRALGATVRMRIHLAEQPAAAILNEAALVGADLIALETHGRGASRVLIGSVADKVVRGSVIPVLVCRCPATTRRPV
jgi:nucleotide-binding universal stress UspA family protein